MTKRDLKAIQCIKLLLNQIHNFGGEWRVSENKNPSSTIRSKVKSETVRSQLISLVLAMGKELVKMNFS